MNPHRRFILNFDIERSTQNNKARNQNDEDRRAIARISKLVVQPAGLAGLSHIEKAREHAVVVALDHLPRLARGHAVHQVLDHAAAIGATVDKVAEVDDGGIMGAMRGAVGGDAGMGGAQKVEMAVDVADGVGDHGLSVGSG